MTSTGALLLRRYGAAARIPAPRYTRASSSTIAAREAEREAEREAMREQLTCPITYELMTDPVTAADGQTYERHAILQWFEKKGSVTPTSPSTNEPLKDTTLHPNIMLRSLARQLFPEEF